MLRRNTGGILEAWGGFRGRPGGVPRLMRIKPLAAVLEQDLQCQLGRAAVLDQLDGPVEVDVVPGGEPGSALGRLAGALELRGAPPLHLLELASVADVD